jgi:hypothetical protein
MNQQRLKELLNYDPVTGVFTWRIESGSAHINNIAGVIKNNGYIKIGVAKKQYLAHRLAWLYMTGEWPLADIDHINRSRTDNRFENLRDVSRSINLLNSSTRKNTASGIKGVAWDADRNKWLVRFRNTMLGRFSTLSEAADAYAMAAKLYHTHNPMAAL